MMMMIDGVLCGGYADLRIHCVLICSCLLMPAGTHFHNLKIEVRPRAGRLLTFHNLYEGSCQVHKGLTPMTCGDAAGHSAMKMLCPQTPNSKSCTTGMTASCPVRSTPTRSTPACR